VSLIAPLTLARIIVIALYAIVALISFRRLIPRLSTNYRRLALSIFALQAVVSLLALQAVDSNTYVLRLFRIIGENSVGVAVAGMQLALVAEIALMTAWLGRGQPAWRRIYLAGFGLLFFFLVWDELSLWRVFDEHSDLFYILAGVVVVLLTARVALRSPRHTWIWFACLLIGLAISAAGGIVLDQPANLSICEPLGLLHFSAFLDRQQCLFSLIEESLELLGIWLVLVAMLGLLSDVVPRPKRPLRWLLYALPVVTFVVCVGVSDKNTARVHEDIQASPADVSFESGVRLYGYQIERVEANYLEVSLWLSALPFGYNGLGYSVHLIDPVTATTLSSRDKFVSVSGSRVRGPWHLPVFRQSLQLDSVADFPRNQAFLVVLSIWREAGDQFARQKVVSSDLGLLNDTQVVLAVFVIPSESAPASPAALATFEDAMTLGLVDLPERARSAETLAISFNWRAENEVTEDYVQFLHFGNEETGEWWVYDQQPLGARLPTRLWYSGLADSETWEISLPADLAPGRYEVFTGLYRQTDLQRLPARDVEGNPFTDARIPLGSVTIERI